MEEQALRQLLSEETNKLLILSMGCIKGSARAHGIEKNLFKQVLSLGLLLLRFILQARMDACPVSQASGVINKGVSSRQYLSLFGKLELHRTSSWSKARGKFYEADEMLELPLVQSSYLIQELTGASASESDYTESVRVMNAVLDLGLSGKFSARNADNLGILVEAYYEEDKVPVVAPQGFCLSVSFDGKGVPKIVERTVKEGSNPKARLGKGEKRGIMEMATVVVASAFIPKVRTAESIINGLTGCPLSSVKTDAVKQTSQENDNRWHKDIHKRAFLANQQKAVDYGIREIKQRLPNADSRFVVPVDGGAGLEQKVLECVKKYGLEDQFDGVILDIIHVSEYVWDAATAVFGEQSKAKSNWVRAVLTDLLTDKTDTVIQDLEKIKNKGDLSETKQKQIGKTINYFTNHKHKMNYKTFIEKGYPVSSALVESACGHLVKERMEQSGMRWSSQGAQNIMDLRAVKLNEDMDDFMKFVIRKQHQNNLNRTA